MVDICVVKRMLSEKYKIRNGHFLVYPSDEEKTLDEMFQELDKLIQAMEEPEVSLEDSFQMYHQGIDMLKTCNDKMDKIEKQMLVLDSEGETHEFES